MHPKAIELVTQHQRAVDQALQGMMRAVGAVLTSPDVVSLDYVAHLRPRPTSFVIEPVRQAIDADREHWLGVYRELQPIMDGPELARVPELDPGGAEPYWNNGYFGRGDASATYAMLVTTRPRVVVEVGSGHSTRFMRKAVRDHGLPTLLVSIDPSPRAEVQPLVDEFIERPLLDVDLAMFGALQAGDVLFIDGSHRALNGSDVTHLFLSVLPVLPRGVRIHVHDINLPGEYDAMFTQRFYSEQYVLGALLLDRSRWRTVLPMSWMLQSGVAPARHAGCSFWLEVR